MGPRLKCPETEWSAVEFMNSIFVINLGTGITPKKYFMFACALAACCLLCLCGPHTGYSAYGLAVMHMRRLQPLAQALHRNDLASEVLFLLCCPLNCSVNNLIGAF